MRLSVITSIIIIIVVVLLLGSVLCIPSVKPILREAHIPKFNCISLCGSHTHTHIHTHTHTYNTRIHTWQYVVGTHPACEFSTTLHQLSVFCNTTNASPAFMEM